MVRNKVIMEEAAVLAADPLTGEESVLLHAFNWSLQPGDWVQVVGPNGSGKSTFIRLLAGQLAQGTRVEASVLERGFADAVPIPYVMQYPEASMIGSSPWEELLITLEQQGMEEALILPAIDRALQEAGLEQLRNRSVATLSGGQKQLTAIISCLASGAPILIMDEATSMLDREARAAVLAAVRRMHADGTTVVWVTHHLDEMQATDRVVGIKARRLVYDGDVDGFYRAKGKGEAGSVCEQLGWEIPYAVQTALALRSHGVQLDPLPLNSEALLEALWEK
ncbi:ABC transporter ATP-binding protein [Paenibacillaceae bacterium]|nr:ABC transporter ATP-binding protein [Paenibacillaceae bacterium]